MWINLGQSPPVRVQQKSRRELKKIRDLHAFSDGLRPAFSERKFAKNIDSG